MPQAAWLLLVHLASPASSMFLHGLPAARDSLSGQSVKSAWAHVSDGLECCKRAGTTSAAGTLKEGDWTLGLSASALSGLSSAYAGVYFEKYVKGKMSSTLWIRNLQLGIYGLPLSIVYMYAKDHANLANGGVMQVTVPCRLLQAVVLCCIMLGRAGL